MTKEMAELEGRLVAVDMQIHELKNRREEILKDYRKICDHIPLGEIKKVKVGEFCIACESIVRG